MVLGHQDCGAIKAACDGVSIGHIAKLIAKLKPAIKQAKSLKNKNNINAIAKINVNLTIQRIRKKSEILRTLEEDKKIQIVGAYYEVSTGKISLLE